MKNKQWDKAFIFADMNAFFASVEQMDDPSLRGRPVAITNGRVGACVITCSYEARAYGVRTGNHIRMARTLCPQIIKKSSRPERYVQVSTRIMKSLQALTPEIEIFSVDEAFMDVTRSQNLFGDPVSMAKQVKDIIYRVSGVKSSVGVADSKLIAKWAAKQNKPDGLTIIEPGSAAQRLIDVPVTEICGINKGIAAHLALHGAKTCGEVARLPMSVLSQRWGAIGKRLHMVCGGYDPEPIISEVKAPKSIGHGKVVPPNTRQRDVIEVYLLHMCFKVAVRLRQYDYVSGHYFVGVKTKMGWCANKYKTMPTDNMMSLFNLCQALLNDQWNGGGVNQVQVTAQLLQKPHNDLFVDSDTQQQKINDVIDQINGRYGELAISPARLMARSQMPNVIAPSWKPYGHRETILSGKYSEGSKTMKKITLDGYIQ